MARDWPAILSAAQARGITPIVLAREVGCDSAAVYFAEKKHGIALARNRQTNPPTFALPFVAGGPEEWRDAPGWSGLYAVSSMGRIRNLTTDRLLKAAPNSRGYCSVGLRHQGQIKSVRFHRLVATAFHSNPDGLPHVNHLDCDKMNNAAANLAWSSFDENFEHGRRAGRSLAINNPRVRRKLSPEDVISIRARAALGCTPALAQEYGVTTGTIRKIALDKSRANG